MSQHIDKIRDLLEHEHFDKIDEFPQIAEQENYSTENGGTTLNEAVADFKQISDMIDTAIEEDIISTFGRGQQNTIRKRLVNVRKQANNIENQNTRRNNPGNDFINSVDKLRSYAIGELSLDLRVGNHLDFSEQLRELREIREEHQKTLQNLEQAEETHKQIKTFHEEIENQKTTIDEIITSSEELQDDLEQIKTDVSNTQQDVENEAQTVNERYEEVLKKTDQINDYEERLKTSLLEVEDRSEQLDEQQDDINDLSDQISDLLNGAIAASLDRNFTDQKEELESSVKFWKWSTFVAIGVLIGFAVYIFQDITQVSEFGVGTVSRMTLLIPALIGVWFTSKNYSRQRKLMEQYAFKATLAQTLEPSRDVLESQLTSDGSDEQLAKFMVTSMGQIFQNPSEILDYSSPNDDDATHIEQVKDLGQNMIGKNSD